MIYVLMDGHNYEHDLYELIRVFLPKDEIVFISDMMDAGNDKYVLESKVLEKPNEINIITILYKNKQLISKDCEKLDILNAYDYHLSRPIKQGVKRGIYNILKKLTKTTLPWGILTGIRPVKITHDLHEKGLKDNEIYNILLEKFKLSNEKASMVNDISLLQRKHIYPIDDGKYSLYVGIPFCPSKCLYCSFPSFKVGANNKIIEEYIDTLLYELKNISRLMEGKRLNTVYIGGGTPTALKASELELIIASIKENFSEDIKEFTIEAGRPDTINLEVLSMLKSHNIHRISINPQTMNDETLELIGRSHSSKSVINAYNLAKTLDFDIINMDIILGLPGENIEHLRNTLKNIKNLNPNNLTVHTLSIKRGSKIFKDSNYYDMIIDSEIEKMLSETFEYTKEMDLFPYYLYRQKQILGNLENLGFCKKNKESIYNIAMMEEKETIIGAGLGAISKIYFPDENIIKRVPNFKNLKEYRDRIDELIYRKQINLHK